MVAVIYSRKAWLIGALFLLACTVAWFAYSAEDKTVLKRAGADPTDTKFQAENLAGLGDVGTVIVDTPYTGSPYAADGASQGNALLVDQTGYASKSVTPVEDVDQIFMRVKTNDPTGPEPVIDLKIDGTIFESQATDVNGEYTEEVFGGELDTPILTANTEHQLGIACNNCTLTSVAGGQQVVFDYMTLRDYDIQIGTDDDGDGVDNTTDNCVDDYNVDQADHESDGIGDLCDENSDADSVPNDKDHYPLDAPVTADSSATDTDSDGVQDDNIHLTPGNGDNCPNDVNTAQNDLDGDLAGNHCDSDKDGDGVANTADADPDDQEVW